MIFKEWGANSGLVPTFLSKIQKLIKSKTECEWGSMVLRAVVVTLSCPISKIMACGCTSSVFPYGYLELRDFIQQRSLAFVALADFFLNEFVGSCFESLSTFQQAVTKKGQSVTARCTEDCLLLFQMLRGTRQQSPLVCHLRPTRYISSAILLYTLLSKHINLVIFLYCFLIRETWSYLFCLSVPTNPVKVNVCLNQIFPSSSTYLKWLSTPRCPSSCYFLFAGCFE